MIAIVTHKVLAIPVFLLMMLCMFALTFGPGQMLADGVDALIGGWFAGGVRILLAAAVLHRGWRPCWWTA